MPKLFLSLAIFLLCFTINAQDKNSSQELSERYMAQVTKRSQPDQTFYKGYLIRVQQGMAGAYGYQISKGDRLVISQQKNPFTNSAVGLRSKADAIKIAKWQITQLSQGTPPAKLQILPKNLSQQLNVPVQ